MRAMDATTVLAVGDLILDEPEPASFFAPASAALAAGTIVIGHVEVPHTDSSEQRGTDVPARPADPAALRAVAGAGFGVVTLAGNHIADCGDKGVLDTVRHARDAGLAVAGAGADLDEAKRPAIVERNGLRVGVLSYNCVGPRESWATSAKPGCAYVHVLTHYELDHASPGGPPKVYTFADPDGLAAMARDIAALRADADVVCVSFHKGVGHTPAKVEQYERQVARAAVDAGADAVFGHHAHIMRGIEVYRGRPIYHGLGNFVTVTRALDPGDGDSPERQAWARRRTELYGFAPDPDMPFYPFHPESRNTAIAVCRFDASGALVEAGFVPCRIDDRGRPVPLGEHDGGGPVAEYVRRISREAGFGTGFAWRGGEVRIANEGDQMLGAGGANAGRDSRQENYEVRTLATDTPTVVTDAGGGT
ncbi:CapA family protein [Actinomadura sp. CNU-125]|uniref:CapA family protein n=1 Tax=Actinomadura sp. CNU-125 TaxID=1904961 RepID=UPI000B280DF3|nr:CapA family protein [Actinomadura sp. CNU-125]